MKTLTESIRNTEELVRRLKVLPPPQGGKWQKAMIAHYESVIVELLEIQAREKVLAKQRHIKNLSDGFIAR
jgi:hypothetical protein